MRRELVCAAVLCGVVLAGCGTQTPSPPSYRDRTEQAVSAVLSEVATVQLVIERLNRHEVQSAYAQIVISDSDDSLGGAVTSYTSLDPPRAEQHLFDQVSAQLGRAQDLVLDARIAASRSDSTTYPTLSRRLSRMASRLDKRDQALQ